MRPAVLETDFHKPRTGKPVHFRKIPADENGICPDVERPHGIIGIGAPGAIDGAVWVEVTFFGQPTKRAIDRTIEILIASRND